MSYWQMDDGFLGHHKTRRALRKGAEALQMWMALRTYVAVNTTDGTVPDEDIDDLAGAPKNPRKWLTVLTECGEPLPDGKRGPGLVDPLENGVWTLHNYRIHGLSAAEVERRKDAARERKRKWRENKDGTRQERRSEHVPETSPERVPGRGTDAPPFPIPHPSPTPGEEKIPLPPSEPDKPRAPRPDPFGDTLRKAPPGKRPDVQRVWAAFKTALKYPPQTKFRGDWDDDARRIADAIDAYDEATCLRVVGVAPRDSMVNGTADERSQKHDTVAYVFENQNTFNRLLRAAEEQRKKLHGHGVGALERAMAAEPDTSDVYRPRSTP